jgi:predicted amidophosphoribosyltransferase
VDNCPWCWAELKPDEFNCPECGQQARRALEFSPGQASSPSQTKPAPPVAPEPEKTPLRELILIFLQSTFKVAGRTIWDLLSSWLWRWLT